MNLVEMHRMFTTADTPLTGMSKGPRRAQELFVEQRHRLDCWTDRLFAALFVVQWLAEIASAIWISPETWEGSQSYVHPHVWTAVFLGGAIISLPILLVYYRPGHSSTRLAIAFAQGLNTAILIHLMGGRIETHFYVFVSLAILAFYRDWRVLLTTALVVALDHFVRGLYWPQSVYGVTLASPWRFLEHSGWVAMEVVFLLLLCRQGLLESWSVAQRQSLLEETNLDTERINRQLREEIVERQKAQLELERARNKAEAASHAKSEFLANMSHELRTPLNSIIGFAEVLVERVSGDLNDNQVQYVTDILESGQHLLALVNDILDLAKIESGSIEIQESHVAMSQLIERTVQLFRERAMRQGIRLVGEVAPQVGVILADERRLKQVLYNLLSNAFKFTPQGGEVRVSVSETAEATLLRVSDTGIGIPQDQQVHIFDSFYQVDSTLTKSAQGTGLGLAMVRQICELHGGDITVTSEVNRGSTFVVSLPHARCQSAEYCESGASTHSAVLNLGTQ